MPHTAWWFFWVFSSLPFHMTALPNLLSYLQTFKICCFSEEIRMNYKLFNFLWPHLYELPYFFFYLHITMEKIIIFLYKPSFSPLAISLHSLILELYFSYINTRMIVHSQITLTDKKEHILNYLSHQEGSLRGWKLKFYLGLLTFSVVYHSYNCTVITKVFWLLT